MEGLTDLQAKVAEETLIFIRAIGRDTGNETFTHWSSRDVWWLVRVSRAEFHKFAASQKLCSPRYVWKVMRKLVDLGYVHVFTAKGEKGYGLTVDARSPSCSPRQTDHAQTVRRTTTAHTHE